MGQGQDRAHAERSHRGVGAQRKEIRYNLAALGIALSLCACAPAQQSAAPGKFSLARQAKFDQDNAWQHLLKQVSFGPRTPGSEGHIKCRDWIAEQMKKSCENVRLQEFSHKWSETGKDVKMWNIIGEQNWKDAKTRMLLIAHWDTRPYASEESDPTKAKQPIVGANDGASGVAVLLELMRVLKERKPELGIMYLMTDGEDLGPTLDEMFLGAKFFAKNLPKPKPDYGILIDMVGDKDLRIPVEQNSYALARTLTTAFYQHAQEIGMSSTFPYVMGPVIQDDHLPLNQAGVPTLDLIDFTYDAWHTLRDTPELCSPSSLGKVGMALELWAIKPKSVR